MPAPITSYLMDMVPDTVSVEPYLSTDAYGKVTYGPSTEYRTRVLGRTKMVLGYDGKERLSGATVVFMGEYGLTVNDRFTLPARFSMDPADSDIAARQPQCLSIDRETDENGAHHTTVYFSVSRLRGY